MRREGEHAMNLKSGGGGAQAARAKYVLFPRVGHEHAVVFSRAFVFTVVVVATRDAEARVPPEFKAVTDRKLDFLGSVRARGS